MPQRITDMHLHVGLNGDQWPQWGGFSEQYRRSLTFQIFLKYARLAADEVGDTALRDRTLEVIAQSKLDRVVCLALDPIYDPDSGVRRSELSHLWVDNHYIIDNLRPALPDKILLGASVHPYDPDFRRRVDDCVDAKAVLLKWIPSSQQFDLADERVGEAMKYLARAKNGRPLPLLLHVGPEYAIPPNDERAKSFDFLTWPWQDSLWNWFRGKKKWHTPRVKQIHANLKSALDAGAVLVFAHCGAPYFSGGILGGLAEHNDFPAVRSYLERTRRGEFSGRCYADVSAFVIPTRRPHFSEVKKLPAGLLLFGSDFPVPIAELSAGPGEWWDDFKAIIKEGQFDRLIIPEGNLLDVNYDELRAIFGDHPLFTNFDQLT